MLITRSCQHCSVEFQAASKKALYCSPEHRQAAYRQRRKAAQTPDSQTGTGVTHEETPATQGVSIEQATRAELAAVKQDATALGLAAIAAAGRVDHGGSEGGSAFAALVRVHAAALTRALEADRGNRGDAVDHLEDELARKREERQRRA